MTAKTKKTEVDLSIDLAGIRMQNPLLTASGTSGYATELGDYLDLSKLGAFTTKSITLEPRVGNPSPRIVETPAGVINSIGLANVGLDRFLAEKLHTAVSMGVPIFVNIAGKTVEEYVELAARLDDVRDVAALEVNISCPNVAAGGLEFGTDAQQASELIRRVRAVVKRAKLVVKLTPNVTDIRQIARAVVDAGADILSLINTVRGMVIDVERRRPTLPRGFGGLSGPAIHPVAVCAVWQVYKHVAKPAGVPLIGMGGVRTWQDALEFILAGASAVAVGTALFVDPQSPITIIEGLTDYCRRHQVHKLSDLIGTVAEPTAE
jgi:dihydroorotate dehydrogenase (NAD+) catalytic subunit